MEQPPDRGGESPSLTSLPRLTDLAGEGIWQPLRGSLTLPTAADGNWRSLPHMQTIEAFREFMPDRIQEFHQLLQSYGLRPDTLECKVCRHRARDLYYCFADGLVTAGGRHHLRKLWSVALSVSSNSRQADVWEEAMVPGGACRMNYVDGGIEVCRGDPPTNPTTLLSSPLRVRRGEALRGRERTSSGSWDQAKDPLEGGASSSSAAPLAEAAVSSKKKGKLRSKQSLGSLTLRGSGSQPGREKGSTASGGGEAERGSGEPSSSPPARRSMQASASSPTFSSRGGGVFAVRARRDRLNSSKRSLQPAQDTSLEPVMGITRLYTEADLPSVSDAASQHCVAADSQELLSGASSSLAGATRRHSGAEDPAAWPSGSLDWRGGYALVPEQLQARQHDSADRPTTSNSVSTGLRGKSFGTSFVGGRGRGSGQKKSASKKSVKPKKRWAGIPDQWAAPAGGVGQASSSGGASSSQAAAPEGRGEDNEEEEEEAGQGSAGTGEYSGCVDAAAGAEAEDSEHEDRVVLEKRPLGFEIGPAEHTKDGHNIGAVVRQVEGHAAEAGLEPGSKILCINEQCVEDMFTSDIQGMLSDDKGCPVPLTLDISLRPLGQLSVLGIKRKIRKRDPVMVCTANCRGSYKVVSEAVAQLGWQELQTAAEGSSKPASVLWAEHADQSEGAAPVQTVSRIEAFLQFCKKVRLANCLNTWDQELPEVFAFSPKTWVLPQDAEDLKRFISRCSKDETVIAKPTAGAQGKGIVLAKKWKDLEAIVNKTKAAADAAANGSRKSNPCEYVVQRYLNSPLLLNGLKFDMRLYVVVTSVVPMRAYLFKEGLARFCTVPYKPPEEGNLREAKMHLTNFAVNKKSKDFQVSDSIEKDGAGSKRSVSSVLRQVRQVYGTEPDEFWGKVSVLAANTLLALRPGLLEYYVHEAQKPLHPLAPKGFQMIGLDVILDGDMEPRLLELNANASLSATQPKKDLKTSDDEAGPKGSDDEDGSLRPQRRSSASSTMLLRSPGGSPGETGPPPRRSPAPASVISLESEGCDGNEGGPQQAFSLSTGSAPQEAGRKELRLRSMGTVASGPPQPKRRGPSTTRFMQPHTPWEEDPITVTTSFSERSTGASAENHAPHLGSAAASSSAASPSASSSARPGSAGARRRSVRQHSRSRAGAGDKESKREKSEKDEVSELDLLIKRELVAQVLLLVRPAPHNKASRLKRAWQTTNKEKSGDKMELVALDDDGRWVMPSRRPTRAEQFRWDAPDRCPAFEPIDFEELAAPEVMEFARSHLQLYRWWQKSCGQGRDSLGQAQSLRMLEKCSLVGNVEGALFPDRVAAQLWLSKAWRDLASGNFGLNLPQFLQLASRLGVLLLAQGGDRANDNEDEPRRERGPYDVNGILEFARRLGSTEQ
eukprot:TRINITY_DN108263_c0_g1_i1.p1 TRINITY_DN108263_c0_g1~~TRINITY_DN108263_c0_g1_i1.p1  ORF type:complete len:1395 (+),score=287.84 TRINITY_DN108263_c0_g1_i1:116-4300(+)